MFLRLIAIAVVAVAAATANHITNTNLLLASQTSPTELAYGGTVELVDQGEIVAVGGIRVHGSIGNALQRLLTAARNDGIILAGWGWRSHQAQIGLRRAHCGTSHYAIWEMPSRLCRPPTARPGRSMHETGLAVDFTCAGRSMAGTRCFTWLQRNAHRYGLYNLPSEPWHWSVNGR